MAVHTAVRPPADATAAGPQPAPPPDVAIYIEGNNAGNIYAGNRFNTYVGAVAGDMVTLVTSAEMPLVEPNPRPVDGRPRDFAGLIGRTAEIRQATASLAASESVEIYAPPGMGKTSLLRYLAWRLPAPPDGVYHLRVAGRPVEDVTEQVFAGFFRSQFPIKQYRAQLLESLRPLQALIILDDVTADRDGINELLDAMPRCGLLLATESRRLWSLGASLPLPGLTPEEGVALFAATLGRRLRDSDREAVRQLCIDLGGNPLAIVQAAAAAEDDDRALAALLGRLPSPPTAEAVAAEAVAAAGNSEQQVLGVLAAADGAPLLPQTIAGVLGGAGAGPALATLEQKQLVDQTQDGRYKLAGPMPLVADAGTRQELLDHLVSWSQANHDNPALVGREVEALRAMMDWAAETEQYRAVLELAHALDAPLTLSGQWATWDQTLSAALHAARVSGDQAEKAWVLHQQGTRALLRDEADAARDALQSALALREELGDTLGAHLTQYHLDLWRFLYPPPPTQAPPPEQTPPPPPQQPRGERLAAPRPSRWRILLPAILIISALGVAALYATGVLPWDRGAPAVEYPAIAGGAGDNHAPVVRVIQPQQGAALGTGRSVTFVGDADDAEDGDISYALHWESDVDGTLGQGRRVVHALSPGDHVISVWVRDADGELTVSQVRLAVGGGASSGSSGSASSGGSGQQPAAEGSPRPDLRILEPARDRTFAFGANILFRARATDDPDGDLSEWVAWDFDGGTARGAEVRRILPPGRHTVTATVRDSDGQQARATVVVNVLEEDQPQPPPEQPPPANRQPEVWIEEITFLEATPGGAWYRVWAGASDDEDGDIADTIAWWSSRVDGPLGYGPSFDVELPGGGQTIIVTARDTAGLEVAAELWLEVPVANAEPVIDIKRPVDGQFAGRTEELLLAAEAWDEQDGNLSWAIVWFSDRDGWLGEGGEITVSNLQPGLHTIIAEVEDATGAQVRAERTITIVDELPDLVASLRQTGEPINADNVFLLIPIRFDVDNIGGQTAGLFKVSAAFFGPSGRRSAALAEFDGSDSFYVWVDSLAPGGRISLEGWVRIDSPEGLFGEGIDLFVVADSNTGDEFLPDYARVEESDEGNNTADAIRVTLPASLE